MAIGGVSYSNQIKALKVGPLDSKSLAPDYASLKSVDYWVDLDVDKPYITNGQLFSTADGHIYQLIDRNNWDNDKGWKEIGGSTITELSSLAGYGLTWNTNTQQLDLHIGTGLKIEDDVLFLDLKLGTGLEMDGDVLTLLVDNDTLVIGDNNKIQLSTVITSKISQVYTYKGSSNYNNLPISAESGDVYNVTDEFVIDGYTYAKGTNVAWVIDTNAANGGYWDPLGGIGDYEGWVDITA